jgi:hypothetical protein
MDWILRGVAAEPLPFFSIGSGHQPSEEFPHPHSATNREIDCRSIELLVTQLPILDMDFTHPGATRCF